ncbi:GNAT family N-acetyltransferase [Halobaculum gomorrense]|uniref:Ribosomal protein S18 acetylase RimI n=1 Tax=Halobaculum gomorrense TaxID=43928 RepID=A0A1M5R8N8_9EURY|nr:GNAT family N-acetyltransferase [Halobaculum gomorrense]SHH22581.1 Ribosomal protein S18 acetylase RimI [Halobaculum gomorrense]
MHVREADRDDAQAIAAVARRSWHAAYGEFLSEEAIDATVDEWYAPKTIRRHVDAAGTFLVAEAEADDAGGDPMHKRVDPESLLGFAHARYDSGVGNVVLRRIYVAPDAWGEGVGTALLGAVAHRFVDDHDRISAVVFAENGVGLSFYERHGFETVGEQTTAFGDGEHDERIVAADLAELASLGATESGRQA